VGQRLNIPIDRDGGRVDAGSERRPRVWGYLDRRRVDPAVSRVVGVNRGPDVGSRRPVGHVGTTGENGLTRQGPAVGTTPVGPFAGRIAHPFLSYVLTRLESPEPVGIPHPDGLRHIGPDATEPLATEGIDVGRVPIGPAVAAETWPGETSLPDPSSD